MEKSKNNRKKKKGGTTYIIFLGIFFALGGVVGYLIPSYYDKKGYAPESFGEGLLYMTIFVICLNIAVMLQIVIHELGHLVFGLISGYKFSSFRVGQFMIIKLNGKIKFKRMSLAGTGGQCLMDPPDMIDGKIPYIAYNFGGAVFNLIFAGIAFVLVIVSSELVLLNMFFLMLTVMGILFALTNGIPLKTGAVDNDGMNAISLGKNSEALRCFWVQMKMNIVQTNGVHLKDMPDEWFELSDDADVSNALISAIEVFKCNRLMEEHKFSEAYAYMEKLIAMESGIIGVYKNLMMCECIYCELIGDADREKVEKMYTKQLKGFAKTMSKFPSVIRMEYTYALLYENDSEKSAKIMKKFNKIARSYPLESDIESERGLIEVADLKAMSLKNGAGMPETEG